jgi:hypothetical protein
MSFCKDCNKTINRRGADSAFLKELQQSIEVKPPTFYEFETGTAGCKVENREFSTYSKPRTTLTLFIQLLAGKIIHEDNLLKFRSNLLTI